MPENIKAIIFDMDGVLIDACQWHYDALNLALAGYGMTITPEEHASEYDGLPTQVKLDRLTEKKGLAVAAHQDIERRKQALTMALIGQNCRPDPQHIEALARLRFGGVRLAVASNSIRKTVDTMLTQAGISPWIEFSLSSEDAGVAKPAPDIYLQAMQRLGVSPEETLIVEDSAHGIKAARASGARVMCVSGCRDVSFPNIMKSMHFCR